MSFLYSSFDESDKSLSSESPQSSPNTSESVQSPDYSRKDKSENFWKILNFSQAFWNVSTDESIEAEDDQDTRILEDGTIFSTSECDIDEISESERMLRLFHQNSVQRRIVGRSRSDRHAEPVISKQLKISNIYDLLLLILVMLVPTSAMAFGAQYIGHCPANRFVPHLLLLIGVQSTIFVVYLIVKLCKEPLSTSGEKDVNGVGKIFGWLLGIFILIEITLFFDMAASFDASSKNYCSKTFYFYAAFFNVFTIASFIFCGLVKLSRSVRHANQSFPTLENELGF